MSDAAGDRQHEATPLRLQKAKDDGDFAKSFELAIALQVLGCAMAIYLFIGSINASVKSTAVQSWHFDGDVSLSGPLVFQRFEVIAWNSVMAVLPLMLLAWLAVVASHWVQTGVVWLPGKAAPQGSRLNPSQITRQFFSLQTLSYCLIGIPKFFLTIAVAAVSCWFQSAQIFRLPFLPTDVMANSIFSILVQLTFHVGLLLLVSSAADYWIRWFSFQRRIRMTDAELREESRAQDGDPIVNGQRKMLYRQRG